MDQRGHIYKNEAELIAEGDRERLHEYQRQLKEAKATTGVMAAGPDAERLVRLKVTKEFAQAHDVLDRYEIPRFADKAPAKDEPLWEHDLPTRVEMLAERVRWIVTPRERTPARIMGPDEQGAEALG